MKTAILLTFALIGIAILSLTVTNRVVQGQQQTPASQAVPIVIAGEPKEGFQLSLSMNKSVFTHKEAVLVTASIKNITSEMLSFAATEPAMDFKVSVKDKHGKALPMTLYGKSRSDGAIFAHYLVELDAGKEANYVLQIDRIYDLTLDGIYLVEITRKVPNIKSDGFVTLSNKFNIKLVEPISD